MIHAENGSVKLDGSNKDLVADLACAIWAVYLLLVQTKGKRKARRIIRALVQKALALSKVVPFEQIDNSGGEA